MTSEEASTIGAPLRRLVESRQLLLHRLRHHAEHDPGRGVRLRVVALALGLAELVGVLALEQPRRRRPVLVARERSRADGREQRPLKRRLLLF
ncbi:hypothetical protein [Candidatus Collinsella stercoripullorum]|uniref:hypothetical protein n=1 Tax=Candidatus Collinsella stercoripullorum TaxID=2838522 RepID=UPI0022E2F76C|nr:hypothetical protein [Candidatus Collinsella stercoripullorum]